MQKKNHSEFDYTPQSIKWCFGTKQYARSNKPYFARLCLSVYVVLWFQAPTPVESIHEVLLLADISQRLDALYYLLRSHRTCIT